VHSYSSLVSRVTAGTRRPSTAARQLLQGTDTAAPAETVTAACGT
jgi:hypothetical protein